MSPFRRFSFPATLYPEVLLTALRYAAGFSSRVAICTALENPRTAGWLWDEKVFLSDNPLNTGLDAVFPPHPESLFLANCISLPFGNKRMLDMGSGCGVLSVTAALRGWTVTAIDINQRAIEATECNATLNNANIAVVKSDLAAALKDEKFSLCLANLPFEPTPLDCKNYLHSDGGTTGLIVIERFARSLNSLCETDGVALLPSFSLFANNRTPLEEILREGDYLSNFDRCVLRLSQPLDLRLIFRRFPGRAWKSSWKARSPKQFVIEIALLKKTCSEGRFGGVYAIPFANRSWIAPLESRHIGKPDQGD